MKVKKANVKIFFAILIIAFVAYGVMAAGTQLSASGESGNEVPASPLTQYSSTNLWQPMMVSSASSSGLGVGGVSGHVGIVSLWRMEGNLGIRTAISPPTVQQAAFAMNDGTGKPIIVLTRSYTDSVWDYASDINQYRYRVLMKFTAIDPDNGDTLWDKTVVTDTYTDE